MRIHFDKEDLAGTLLKKGILQGHVGGLVCIKGDKAGLTEDLFCHS